MYFWKEMKRSPYIYVGFPKVGKSLGNLLDIVHVNLIYLIINWFLRDFWVSE